MCEGIKQFFGTDATHEAINSFVTASEAFEPCTYAVHTVALCCKGTVIGHVVRLAAFISDPLDALIKVVAAHFFAACIPLVDIWGSQPCLMRTFKILTLAVSVPVYAVLAGNPIAIFLIKPSKYVYEGKKATNAYMEEKQQSLEKIGSHFLKSGIHIANSFGLLKNDDSDSDSEQSEAPDYLGIGSLSSAIDVSGAASDLISNPCTLAVQTVAWFCGDSAIGHVVRLVTFASLPADKAIATFIAPIFAAAVPFIDIIGPQPWYTRIAKGAGLVVAIPICIMLMGNPILIFLSKLSKPCGHIIGGYEGSKKYLETQHNAWAQVKAYSKAETSAVV